MNKLKTGIFTGLGSGLSWAINGILLGIIYALDLPVELFVFPLVMGMLNDGIAGVTLLGAYENVREKIIKALLTDKNARMFILSGFIAGPIGMSGYYLSAKYAGAPTALLLTSMFPIVSILIAKFRLHEKMNNIMLGAVTLAIGGLITLGFVPASEAHPQYLLGVFCAIMSMLAWGVEGAIVAWAADKVEPRLATAIRQLSSGIFYAIILLTFFATSTAAVWNSLNINAALLLVVMGVSAALSYSWWYRAIQSVGVATADTLNVTYGLWGLILTALFIDASSISSQMVFGGVMLFIASSLVIYGKKKLDKLPADCRQKGNTITKGSMDR